MLKKGNNSGWGKGTLGIVHKRVLEIESDRYPVSHHVQPENSIIPTVETH
jgi:hypothetical protein